MNCKDGNKARLGSGSNNDTIHRELEKSWKQEPHSGDKVVEGCTRAESSPPSSSVNEGHSTQRSSGVSGPGSTGNVSIRAERFQLMLDRDIIDLGTSGNGPPGH